MLYDMYSWLNDGAVNFQLNTESIELSDVDKAQQVLLEMRRKLLAEVRTIRFEKSSDAANVSDQEKQLQHYETYQNFIDFCKLKLKEHIRIPLCRLGIEYLLALYDAAGKQQDTYADKISFMFDILLAKSSDIALDLYHKNIDKLSTIKKITFSIESNKTKQFLQYLSLTLVDEKNAVDIAPLFREYISDTAEFAACILWLLQKKVSERDIFQANLLQYFMLYNLSSLHAPDSPIIDFYALLYQFPEARALIQSAGNIRCEERGFHSYALTGVCGDENKLQRITVSPPTIKFTVSQENVDALYKLFGQSFLLGAFDWYVRSGNQGCADELARLLNQVISLNQLSQLINQIASYENCELVKSLAALLANDTLDMLIAKHYGSILHLLPFRSDLCKKISAINVKDYIRQLNKSSMTDYETIPQLMAMLFAFHGRGDDVVDVIYDAIIDRLMLQPQYMDDDYLLDRLNGSVKKSNIITRKYRELQTALDAKIDEQISLLPFSMESYQTLEDYWNETARKIAVLNEFNPLLDTYPADKYTFQAHVANNLFKRHGSKFDLDEFSKVLGVEAVFDKDDVTQFERILIEVLTRVDDDAIRSQIISKLKQKYPQEEAWIHKKYGEEGVYIRTAKQGNVGLLAWMESRDPTPGSLVGVSAYQAAQAGQWKVVDYFCRMTSNKPKQYVLNDIFVLAAAQGELKTVMFLCDTDASRPHKRTIEYAFQQAAAYHQLEVMTYLCKLGNSAPSNTILVKEFKKAVQHRQWDLMHCIARLADNNLLQLEVNRTFLQACANADLQLARMLCNIDILPRQSAINKALFSAASAGQTEVVNLLCTLPDKQPGEDNLRQAWRKAVQSGHLHTVEYLYSCKLFSVSESERLAVLKEAVKLGYRDIVSFLRRSAEAINGLPASTNRVPLNVFGLFAEQKSDFQRDMEGPGLVNAASHGAASGRPVEP